MEELVLTPADFVAVVNQTLEFAYPKVVIEGELSSFRVAKNRWVYFDLKDETASVAFFGTVYQMPGPLEDGIVVRVSGAPRLHPRFGFSVNVESLVPVGKGSLKKAADLLYQKLAKESLFAPERKRLLPELPEQVGLITAANSAAYGDFIKILGERWGGVTISLADVYVQGEQAVQHLVAALRHFNELPSPPDVLVVTRGGGSADDLAAFNDERVVRAVAASRIPTLIAIGHEVDISLAELAADMRASTPTNAAQILVPDRHHELLMLKERRGNLQGLIANRLADALLIIADSKKLAKDSISRWLLETGQTLANSRRLVELFNPSTALRRGYAIIRMGSEHIHSIKQVKVADKLQLQVSDGTIQSKVVKAARNG